MKRVRGQAKDSPVVGQPRELIGTEIRQGSFCSKCGAWRGELGQEPTPQLYIDHLVLIFNEVKRVLKRTGSLWVNIDDSYAGGGNNRGNNSPISAKQASNAGATGQCAERQKNIGDIGISAKSLCLIPQRFAIAMVENGWILRNDIVWNKPNPMPESIKDRFTGSWEHVFFFTKNNKVAYWVNPRTLKTTDKQPPGVEGIEGEDWEWIEHSACQGAGCNSKRCVNGKIKSSLWEGRDYWFEQQFEKYTEPLDRWGGDTFRRSSHKYIDSWEKQGNNSGLGRFGATSMFREGRPVRPNEFGRNKRDVWTINTEPYEGAHFAVFARKLCETPILAGCPAAICKKCGKAREKVYELETIWRKRPNDFTSYRDVNGQPNQRKAGAVPIDKGYTDCGCNAGFEPGVVLDPFTGSGTAQAVAKNLGRKSIGIELNPDYCKLAAKRLQEIPMAMEMV